MDGLMDRVVSGKIFKNLASFVRGDSQGLEEANDRLLTADGRTTTRQETSESNLPSSHLEHFGNGKKRRASETDRECPESPSHVYVDTVQYDEQHYEGSEDDEETFHESRTSLDQRELPPSIIECCPPLTSRHLKIFTFPGDFGEISTGLALTKNMVWQLNAIHKSGYKIDECTEAIRQIDERLWEWNSMVKDLRALLADAHSEIDQSDFLSSLQEAKAMVVSNEQKKSQLENKLQYWVEEKELPLRQKLQNLNVALESNGLLDQIPDDLEGNIQDFEDIQSENITRAGPSSPSPSPSEIAQRRRAVDEQEALDILQERRFKLQTAQATVENWKEYCDDQYSHFLQLRAEGVFDASKTEFDVDMVLRGQAATRELIQAEEELDEIVKYARMLKLDFEEFDQESGFVSHIEDGYVESMDPSQVHSVDRERIESWMSESHDGVGETVEEMMDWDYQTVDVNDSVSVIATHVATGKERKRIDRWRSVCEVAEVAVQQKDDEEQVCS